MDTVPGIEHVHRIAIPQYIGPTGRMFGYPALSQVQGSGDGGPIDRVRA